MRALGVDIVRISPQASQMEQVIDLFHRALTGELDALDAGRQLERLMPSGACDGYWFGTSGMEQRSARAEELAAH
jgi:collagenase-like PrtC family protease